MVAIGGVLVTLSACRRAAPDDPVLPRLALGAYGLRLALGPALYALSASRGGRGFWLFAPDAADYHDYAVSIALHWRDGVPSPDTWSAPPYLLLLAAIYRLFGPVLLAVIGFNAWFGGLAVVRAYLLGEYLGGRRTARASAVAIGFFPSSVLWSTQLLKDSAALALILYMLERLVALWQRASPPPGTLHPPHFGIVPRLPLGVLPPLPLGEGGVRALRPLIEVTLACFALSLLRYYVGWALVAASALVAVLALALPGERRPRRLVLFGLTSLSLGVAVAGAPVSQNLLSRELRTRYIAAVVPIMMRSVNPERRLTSPNMPVVEPIVNPLADLLFNLTPEGLKVQHDDTARGAGALGKQADLSSPRGVLEYAPYGIGHFLLGPFPNEWFSLQGPRSYMKAVAGLEVLLIYLLTPSILIGAARGIRRRPAETILLLGFVLAITIPVGVAIGNSGTLFRLRIMALAPLLVIACAWGLPGARSWVVGTRSWISGLRCQRSG